MALYEHVLIARQDIQTTQVDAIIDDVKKIIEDNEGKVSKQEYWGLRNLAYKIKKNRKGHYVLLNIDAPAPALAELERNLRIHDDVVRYMTIRVDELEEGPSVMMQKPSRDDRGDRGPRRDRDDSRKSRNIGSKESTGNE